MPDLQRPRVDEGGGAAMTPEEVVAILDGQREPSLMRGALWHEDLTGRIWNEAAVRDWVKRKQDKERAKR